MTAPRSGPQGCAGRADAGVSMHIPLFPTTPGHRCQHHTWEMIYPSMAAPGSLRAKGSQVIVEGVGRARQQEVNRELELVKMRRRNRDSGDKGRRGTARWQRRQQVWGAGRASPGANGSAGHDVLHERWKEEESRWPGFRPRRPRGEPGVPAPQGPAPLGPPS